ncbi:hypothetical protein D3C76_503710 [compost metagenome]
MAPIPRNVMVLCPHLGRLLNYSVLFNRLGIFKVHLCADLEDVQHALARHRHYDLFLYDGPNPDVHILGAFHAMSAANSFCQLVLAGSFTKTDRHRLFDWAWDNRVPLLQLLEKPFTLLGLREVVDGLVSYEPGQQRESLYGDEDGMCASCIAPCSHGHWTQPEGIRSQPYPPCALR